MTPIYHITHVDNLERIIACQGLWCDAVRVQQGFDCVGIAHEDLKLRRARTIVPVASQGTLAEYVPFYFANRSPMLYSIHTGHVVGYNGGQGSIIYLVSSVETVVRGNYPWCLTSGHAVEAMTCFFDNLARLDQVDWDVINHWSWKNTDADPDRKRRKQAEFLVLRSFPWSCVESIGVIDAPMRQRVSVILAPAQHRPPVVVQPKWYY